MLDIASALRHHIETLPFLQSHRGFAVWDRSMEDVGGRLAAPGYRRSQSDRRTQPLLASLFPVAGQNVQRSTDVGPALQLPLLILKTRIWQCGFLPLISEDPPYESSIMPNASSPSSPITPSLWLLISATWPIRPEMVMQTEIESCKIIFLFKADNVSKLEKNKSKKRKSGSYSKMQKKLQELMYNLPNAH